jgi:uncharacterized protein with ParB-like and HNH nuclease domain
MIKENAFKGIEKPYGVDVITSNKAEIISISQFLKIDNMRIPEYQRPYKWTEKNVMQLINDIFIHKDKSRYRLGTIVIHQNYLKEEDKVYNDIVDGQQRFTTLRIILYALCKLVTENKNNYESYILEQVQSLKYKVDTISIDYNNKESVKQIANNYQVAFRSLSKFDTLTIKAFLEKCEVVVFYITDLTEAFQFFDSQNSRGKDLYPHDLLKAFHLREFDELEYEQQIKVVNEWEGYESKELAYVFADYLYRIKGWSDQNSSRKFLKKDIGMFKGINISNKKLYPYIKPMQIAHSFVDNYNHSFERQIDNQSLAFPFQLDNIMINGRRFFEYTAHYKKIIEEFKVKYEVNEWADNLTFSQKIFYLVYYNNRNYREGERYLKNLFECLVIYYIDKFGYSEFDYFLEKAFVWVFSMRFNYQRLGFDSIDKYVIEHTDTNFFHLIRKAIYPNYILNIDLSGILPDKIRVESYSGMNNDRMDFRIGEFFKQKMYYAN